MGPHPAKVAATGHAGAAQRRRGAKGYGKVGQSSRSNEEALLVDFAGDV